jgi:6-phosphogluconolactonase (cycloisomerase 2 family)
LALGKEGSKLLYLTCELDNTVRVLSYKEDKLQQVAAYQLSSNANNYLSDIHYISGQVYVALRGDDKIMIFSTNE